MQPALGAAQNTHVLSQQACFFFQFAKHRVFRAFIQLDPALRKLPRMFLDALTPKHLVLRVAKDDSDIWAITVSVNHGPSPSNSKVKVILSQNGICEQP